MFATLLQVALGGAIGASIRYLAVLAAARLWGLGFPFGTLIVNVVGSALMGVVVVILAERGAERAAPFLMTGVLGGFTTFSAFSLETISLYERGQTLQAGVYIVASVALSLGAFALAMSLMREAVQ